MYRYAIGKTKMVCEFIEYDFMGRYTIGKTEMVLDKISHVIFCNFASFSLISLGLSKIDRTGFEFSDSTVGVPENA